VSGARSTGERLDRKHKMGGTMEWLQRHAKTVGSASHDNDGDRSGVATFIIQMFKLLRAGTVADIPLHLREAVEWWADKYMTCDCNPKRGRHHASCPKWIPKRRGT